MVISSLKRKINPLFRSVPNVLKNNNCYYLFIKLVFNINTYISFQFVNKNSCNRGLNNPPFSSFFHENRRRRNAINDDSWPPKWKINWHHLSLPLDPSTRRESNENRRYRGNAINDDLRVSEWKINWPQWNSVNLSPCSTKIHENREGMR